ncbi:acyltransferase [Pseudomonas sp. KCA11]|uniref:acyltransferase family protein n=3 Tax=unclassified Pseudomonas TaxID=196821 RepID=UPI001F1F288B|nr:acyltransferase family protein [Pseudomonas sp. KCA11]MCE5993430.1 acyltransferase [Pseudomonas sp. KCA11]
MSNKIIAYRPDIDGLRALAVLAVVIFHFNKQWLPGGFVGVDVFFVISGYLITGIVARQLSAGEFRFTDFYLRRIRRIFPATAFMIFVTLLAGIALMLPADVNDLSGSALASLLSVANVYFWKYLDVSYFAASSDMVPLLHMWSLGVEEQFYLLWPACLFIAFAWGGRHWLVIVAVLVAIASFICGQLNLAADQKFAYYMLPSRAGELLIGAVTYFICQNSNYKIQRIYAELMAVIGLVIVVWSLVTIRESNGFPGLISILPTIGVALLIAAGTFGPTVIGKLFSLRPIVAIGLVSFSLYLWHWPVLAFYRYAMGEPDLLGGGVCLVIIIVMTLFSYFFVEKPFRHGGASAKALALSGLLVATCMLSGVALYFNGVIQLLSPKGYAEALANIGNNTGPAFSYRYVCQVGAKPEFLSDKRCVVGDVSKEPRAILFGDSNAAHFMGYFKVLSEHYGFALRNIEHSSCPPFPDELSRKYTPPAAKNSCVEFNRMVRSELSKYETVVLGASWHAYAKEPSFESDFRRTLKLLTDSGKSVVIALRAPGFVGYDRECSKKQLKIPFMSCEKQSSYVDKGDIAVNKLISDVARDYPRVTVFGLRNLICKNGTCSAYMNGIPLYYDEGHLSIPGSEMLGAEALRTNSLPLELLRVLSNNSESLADTSSSPNM